MKVYLFDLLPYDQHFDQYKADRHLPYPLPGDHFEAAPPEQAGQRGRQGLPDALRARVVAAPEPTDAVRPQAAAVRHSTGDRCAARRTIAAAAEPARPARWMLPSHRQP